MNDDIKKARRLRTRDEASALRFIEELSWLLSTHSNVDFKLLADIVKNARNISVHQAPIEKYVSSSSNIHFLVGVLPRILADEKLFPNNEDIAQFAEKALGIRLSRWEKKSKHELIGLIVCNVNDLDDSKLSKLVDALALIISGDKRATSLMKRDASGKMDWNSIIQKITSELAHS
jgi:hypothetical protein